MYLFCRNKAAIIKAGAVHKMLKIIETPHLLNPSVSEAIVANFLSLSALDSNKPIIDSSGAIPFLVNTLNDLDLIVKRSASIRIEQVIYMMSRVSSHREEF